MKSEVKPAVAAVIILVIVVVAAVFVFRGANGNLGTKSPGQVGNAGPFAPGGAANGKASSPVNNGSRTHTVPPPNSP